MSPKAATGCSGTPLPRKLGIRASGRALFVAAPEHVDALIGPLPPGLTVVARPAVDLGYVHMQARAARGRRGREGVRSG